MKLFLNLLFIVCFQVGFSQELKFEYPNLEKAILKKYPEIDLNSNGKIEKREANKVEKLNLTESQLIAISDIKYFKNLRFLSVLDNFIEEIVLDDLPKLQVLYCTKNKLTKLKISNMPKLEEMACAGNQLSTIEMVNCPNLKMLVLRDNRINSLDLHNFKKLKHLAVDDNQLSSLDISGNPALTQFFINGNKIDQIDITRNQKLMMEILYMDDHVKIIGTPEQMKKYKKAPVVIGI
ncbi:hypothetical protein GCM10027051_18010 [Niabella terrae]